MTLIHHLDSHLAFCCDIIFDYDDTIAKIPINWLDARVGCAESLKNFFPSLVLPEGARMDEMEALVMEMYPEDRDQILAFRNGLESAVDGDHIPHPHVVELVRYISAKPNVRLFILSNNLHNTILNGLNQMGLAHHFTSVLGVDDIGFPKPHIHGKFFLEQQFGVSPETALFIGDSPHTDGLFASRANYRFINIKEMTYNAEEL